MNKSFTLIELLIVVTIISILALIGAQNYAEVTTKAKLARINADLASYATAIEVYALDNNRVPRMTHARFYNDSNFDYFFGVPVNGTMSKCITTPIAYLQSNLIADPFMVANKRAPLDEVFYTYQDIGMYNNRYARSNFWENALSYYGLWRLASVGPDMAFDHNFANSAQLPYDSTNGTFSSGNIWRSQTYTEITTLPPIPTLLGAH